MTGIDMLGFLRDSVLMLIAWFCMGASFNSWGNFCTRVIGLELTGKRKFFTDIWLGWFFSVLFFSVYQLFLPIDAFASTVFYLPAIIYFFYKHNSDIASAVKKLDKVTIVLSIFLLCIIAFMAVQPPVCFDAGLYHLNSIRWLNEHHIIKGLGNLHTRLGFNQLYFLYSASLNFHPYLNDFGFHAANSFLFALFCIGLLINGKFIDYLLLALIQFIPMPLYWVSCPTPDIASTLLLIMIFRQLLDVFYYSVEEAQKPFLIIVVLINAIFLLSLKLSNIAFVAGIFIIAAIYYKKNPSVIFLKNKLMRALSLIAIFIAVWIVRGYIQTGCPFYPSTFGRIDFDWAVTSESAKQAEKEVYVFARLDDYDQNSPLLSNFRWLEKWAETNIFSKANYITDDSFQNVKNMLMLLLFPGCLFNFGFGFVVLTGVSVFLLGIWLGSCVMQKKLMGSFYLLAIWFVCAVSIFFWFFMAPAFRFSNGISIVFAVVSMLLVKSAFQNITFHKRIWGWLGILPVLTLLWVFLVQYCEGFFAISGIKTLDKVSMEGFVTASGLEVLVPTNGTQCWDSALPSTPEKNKFLSLRSNTIDDGFCVKYTK